MKNLLLGILLFIAGFCGTGYLAICLGVEYTRYFFVLCLVFFVALIIGILYVYDLDEAEGD